MIRIAAKKCLCILLAVMVVLPVLCAGSTIVFAESTTPTEPSSDTEVTESAEDTTVTTDPTIPVTTQPDEYQTGVMDTLGNILGGITDLTSWLNPATLINNLLTEGCQWMLEQTLTTSVELFSLVSSVMTASFFTHSFITETMNFFKWLALWLTTFGFLKALFELIDKARHGEYAAWQDMIFSIMRTYGMILLCQPIVVLLQGTFALFPQYLSATPDDFSSASGIVLQLSHLPGYSLIILFLLSIFIFVISILMVYKTFQRFIVMYAQIAAGYFHCYDIMSGQNVISEWARDVVAGFVTYAFQIILYQMGMTLIVASINTCQAINWTDGNLIVGLICLAGVGAVAFALRKFGYSKQQGSRAWLGQAVSLAGNAAMRLI